MKYYIIINGVSSETIQGLAIESLPAISKPLQRSKQETIDGRDGDIITKLGYSAYDKTLKIGLWGNYDIDEVIKYFDTEGTITFSNEPDMYYNFNILNRIDFINQLEAFRKATITIHCQPFKYKEETTETLELEEHQEEGTSFNLEGTYEAPMQIDLKGNTSQQILPDGYTQVDYIVCSGTQYIKTGYKPNANTNVLSKCYVSDFSLSKNYICGTLSGSPAKNRYQICFGAITSSFNTMWCRDESTHRFSITPPTKPFDITTSGENITIDGTTYTYTDTQAFDSNAKELYLMAVNNNGSASDIGNGVRLYSFKIYESSSLLHNYIPCYRNSDNEVGLYDLITNTFLTNAGTGSFTYGSIAPTPSSPIPINNVSGNNNVIVCGKNLFDKNTMVINSAIDADNGNMTSSDNFRTAYIKCKPNTTYSISKILSNRFVVGFTSDEDLTLPKALTNVWSNQAITTKTITSPNNAYYMFIALSKITDDTTPIQDILDSLQVEINETPTTYEAYNGTTYPINLPSGMELCKIGTYQDYIYKEDDKWYLHKEIGKTTLDGSESWSASHVSGFTTLRYRCNLSSSIVNYLGYCDKFTMRTGSAEDVENCYNTTAQVYISINPSRLSGTAVSDFTNWLSNNNVIDYYVPATPTNTEITDTTLIEQLNAIKEATSYNGTTNILQTNNDLPFILDIDYFTGTNEITITNNGNTYSKPTLTLTGSGVIGIYLNDSQIFQVSLGTDETIIIDINNMEAYYDATLKNRQVIGDYNNFRLIAGENKIKLTGNWDKLSVDNYSRWI